MPSEVTQIITIAASTAGFSSPQVANLAKPISNSAKEIPQAVQQILATNSTQKIASNPKQQSVSIQKRTEPNFATQDESNNSPASIYSKKAKKK